MAQIPALQHGTRAVLFHLTLILVLQSRALGAKLLKGSSPAHDGSGDLSAKQNEIDALARRSKLPAHGRVAVIVRGRGFRGGRFTAGCMSSAWEAQKNETKSLIAKVVDPLLGRGNSVDLFISEASGRRCSLRKDLMALYSSFAQPPSPSTSNGQRTLGGMYTSMRQAPAEHSRHNLSSFYAEKPQIAMFLEKVPDQILLGDMYAQKREQQQQQQHRTALHVFQEDPPRSLSQGSGLISALDFFKRRAKRRQEYDLILVLRHDILWKIAIDQWKVTKDYTKLNFMSQCEPKTKILNCVNDVAWTMPGRMYDAFASSIGRGHCFNQTECSIERGMCHGHHCKEVMMNLTGSTQESYLTEWVPKRNLRDRSNPIAVLR